MKKSIFGGIILVLLLASIFSGCGGGNSGVGTPPGGSTFKAGDQSAFNINDTDGNVTFKMRYVPGGLTFPTGTDDSGTGSVSDSYWIAETEVTYELWNKVKIWATGYTFVTGDGHIGSSNSDSEQQPVTYVNLREAVIWCNALTEYYYKGSKNCVYYSDAGFTTPIRSVNDTNIDTPYVKPAAKGFRLPSDNEWELAARYRGGDNTNAVECPADSGIYWTKGNSASGATTYYNDNSNGSGEPCKTANDLVAVYYNYWDGSSWKPTGVTGTAAVKSKVHGANTLGLYDMSGNVYEMCITKKGSYYSMRGGSWVRDSSYLMVGYAGLSTSPDNPQIEYGFRLVRNQ